MGSLSVPASGVVYVDTAPVIYTVERHAEYEQLLLPVWEASDGGAIEVVTSELTLLETLVKPLRDGNQPLAGDYERLLTATAVRMLPVTAVRPTRRQNPGRDSRRHCSGRRVRAVHD